MSSGRSAKSESLGASILRTIEQVIERVQTTHKKTHYPGEGQERPFRSWLVSDLLQGVLRWPQDKIVVGERFDVLLIDDHDFPIATIETKKPYHKATKKEREGFEKRLEGFGSLRTAFFTNGRFWERLDIFAPTGRLNIHHQEMLDLSTATAEDAESFYAPLRFDRYSGTVGVQRNRSRVLKTNLHSLEALASDLNQMVGDMAIFYQSLFLGHEQGKLGPKVRTITLNLFDRWCRMSLITPPGEAIKAVKKAFAKVIAKHQTFCDYCGSLGLVHSRAQRP